MYTQKLQDGYANFGEWEVYSDLYGLAGRLGFDTAQQAWHANPTIQGSTNPADFKIVNDEANIPLAGHMLDKDMLLPVAWWLLLDVYWDDDREGEYDDECRERGDAPEQNLVDRPVSPKVPDELDAMMRLSHICGRIEQLWGRSFYDVATAMYGTDGRAAFPEHLQTLIYRTIMACIGHGIGPDDDGDFPKTLDARPITIENPMQHSLDLLS